MATVYKLVALIMHVQFMSVALSFTRKGKQGSILVAMVADEDTATGLLTAGMGRSNCTRKI